jgi:hypothetical protein
MDNLQLQKMKSKLGMLYGEASDFDKIKNIIVVKKFKR